MSLLDKIQRVVRERPYSIARYVSEAVRFSANHVLYRMFKPKNVEIGTGAHLMSVASFCAERPNGHITIKKNAVSGRSVRIYALGQGTVTFGEYCSIGERTRIFCRNRVEIGNHCLISWGVQIFDFEAHPIDFNERKREIELSFHTLFPRLTKGHFEPYASPAFKSAPVVIEDGVWIGANAIILKGAHIGRGSIIGAGSVVTGQIPPMCVAAGNPARVVKQIQKV